MYHVVRLDNCESVVSIQIFENHCHELKMKTNNKRCFVKSTYGYSSSWYYRYLNHPKSSLLAFHSRCLLSFWMRQKAGYLHLSHQRMTYRTDWVNLYALRRLMGLNHFEVISYDDHQSFFSLRWKILCIFIIFIKKKKIVAWNLKQTTEYNFLHYAI